MDDLPNSTALQFSPLQNGDNSLKRLFVKAAVCIGPNVSKKNQLELTWAKRGSLTRIKWRSQRNRVSVDFTVQTVKGSTRIIELEKPDPAVTLHGDQGQKGSQASGKVDAGHGMLRGTHTMLSSHLLTVSLCESTSFFPHPVGCSLCSRLLAEDSFTRVPEHSCYMSGYMKTISLISVDLNSKSQGCNSDWSSWGKMVPKVGLIWWSWGTGSHCTGWLLGRSSIAFDSETC